MQPIHYLMREPHLGNMLKRTVRGFETNIPQMISFTESEVDQQLWERFAKASYISDSETELNLSALMRDMLGSASVPALFGKALFEKYPDLLHDVYDLDAGLYFFLMGLPAYTPWPGVMKAHMARSRIWAALGLLSPSFLHPVCFKAIGTSLQNLVVRSCLSPDGFRSLSVLSWNCCPNARYSR